MNKNKPADRKDKIIFINASKEFTKHPEVRRLNSLSDDNIKNITDGYRRENHTDGFARLVELSEIEENDFNLNVSLYVFPEEETEKIDVKKEWALLENVEKDIGETNKKIKEHIATIYS